MNKIKLWLDDLRDPEKLGYKDYVWVKTYKDAIDILKTGKVKFASLDHDLGLTLTGEKTGYDVVCWMEENNVWPEDGVRVHSQNPVGAQKMKAVLRKHYSVG